MPAVAEVQFKASGSQQVVTAFNSVGTAAQTSATKVQQNSTAMKSMGTGMKSTVSSIGQAATAFATLSLSVVSTWRAYRDLGDAQNAVDKANKKVTTATIGLKKAQDEVNRLTKEGKKGSLESVAATDKIRLMEQKLAADRKSGKKTALELKVQEDAINLAKKEGAGKSKDLMAAEDKLGVAQETLRINTNLAGEAQERFNDIQQNFYLSIAPLAISTIGTLATAFSGLKGILTGGGGLLGGLGPIALILGGISVAILAFKTNFLGFRDAVGGVIDWIKERFGLWKDTIEKVFNLIKSGDWNGAFNLIKEGAAKFWEDIKKSVPFFGEVEKLVEKIKNGNWKGAFLQIWKAATDAWATIKNNIPILGDIETIIRDISEAKWGEAFQKIVDVAKEIFSATLGKGIAFLFGDNWKLGLDAWLVLQEAEAKAKNRPLVLQYALTINASIADVTGIDLMKWFKEHPIAASLPFGLGFTVPVDDPAFRKSVMDGATVIITKLGAALDSIAGLMDPYIAGLFVEKNWTDAVESSKTALWNTGKVIWKYIFEGIGKGLTDQNWLELLGQVPMNIQEWTKKHAPETFKTSRQAAAGGPLQAARQQGVELNPIIPDNFWTRAAHDLQVKLGIIHPELEPKLVLNPEEGRLLGNAIQVIKPPEIKTKLNTTDLAQQWGGVAQTLERGGYKIPEMKIDGNTALLDTTVQTAAANIPQMTPPKMPIDGNVDPFNKTVQVQVGKVQKTTAKMKIDGDTNPGLQKANALRNSINNMKATIKVGITPYSPAARALGQSSYDAMVRKALSHQHGYSGTVKRPTMFMAGEGGRPEDVTVRPRGSVQRGGSSGGGGSTHITVSFEPAEFAQFIRYRINDNQGVVK